MHHPSQHLSLSTSKQDQLGTKFPTCKVNYFLSFKFTNFQRGRGNIRAHQGFLGYLQSLQKAELSSDLADQMYIKKKNHDQGPKTIKNSNNSKRLLGDIGYNLVEVGQNDIKQNLVEVAFPMNNHVMENRKGHTTSTRIAIQLMVSIYYNLN